MGEKVESKALSKRTQEEYRVNKENGSQISAMCLENKDFWKEVKRVMYLGVTGSYKEQLGGTGDMKEAF